MISTPLDLIKLSLKMAGVSPVGTQPLAEDVNDCFILLNSMIESWNQSRWLIWHLVDVACPATGAISYTVGPGGDFNVYRPDRIQTAYVRLVQSQPNSSGPTDIPLGNIQTMEEYSAIRIKQLKSFPSMVFYDATLVLGTLYVWPIPSSLYEVHIIVKERLAEFATLTSPITFPPEYFEALLYNLVGRIQLLYTLPVNPGIIALARAALNTVETANHRVADLAMPAGLSRTGGAWPMHGIGGITEGTFTFNEDTLG